jgi:hypothetical protein
MNKPNVKKITGVSEHISNQKSLENWLEILPSEEKLKIISKLLVDVRKEGVVFPLESIEKTVSDQFSELQTFLVTNIDQFTKETEPDIDAKHEVEDFVKTVQQLKLSVLQHYLDDKTNQYRTLSIRLYGLSFHNFMNINVNYENQTIIAERSDNGIIKTIHIDEIEDINWSTDLYELQRIFCVVDQVQRKSETLLSTIKKIIIIRNLEKYIKDLIENYSDGFNIGGLIKHSKIKKFEEWLTSSERVDIPFIDDEIKTTHGRFISLLEKKVGMLKERRDNIKELNILRV